MSSTLSSPPQPVSLSAPRPILSLKATPELTWMDQLSRSLPLLLVGLPLGVTVVLIMALTPASAVSSLWGRSGVPVSVSPDQVTKTVDVNP